MLRLLLWGELPRLREVTRRGEFLLLAECTEEEEFIWGLVWGGGEGGGDGG